MAVRPSLPTQSVGPDKWPLRKWGFGEKGTSGGGEGLGAKQPGLSFARIWLPPCLASCRRAAARGTLPVSLRGGGSCVVAIPAQRGPWQGKPVFLQCGRASVPVGPVGWRRALARCAGSVLLAAPSVRSPFLSTPLPRLPAPMLAAENPSLTTAPSMRR